MFSTCLTLVLTLLFATPGDEPKDVKDFEQRVQRYWDLRNQIDAATPPIPTDDPTPEQIVSREDALDERIRAARADAREGDIFTTKISGTLKAIIRRQLSSKHGAAAREMILGEGNPANAESGVSVDLKVNGEYPTDAPISQCRLRFWRCYRGCRRDSNIISSTGICFFTTVRPV